MTTSTDSAIMSSLHDVKEIDFDIESNIPNNDNAQVYQLNFYEKYKEVFIKLSMILTLIMIVSPFMLLDIIIACTDQICVNIYPEGLSINMKDYLLVWGFVSLTTLVYKTIFISIYIESYTRDAITFLIHGDTFIFVINCLSCLWNIFGAYIFCSKFYNNKNCQINIYIYYYLFSSIIVKMSSSIIFYVANRQERIGNEIPQ